MNTYVGKWVIKTQIIRNIAISFLVQQGYFANQAIDEKIETPDTMLTSLTEELEGKGRLDYSRWENKIRKK